MSIKDPYRPGASMDSELANTSTGMVNHGATPHPRASTVEPQFLGRYAIIRRLAAGGMGVVYEAHDPMLNRRVALKLVHVRHRAATTASKARKRLLREAQAMAKLSHPNVITVHDAGVLGDDVFVAMELVDGMTLRRWLEATKRTPDQILGVFLQAGRGLKAAHEAGLIHRDFKPDNVMIGNDGRVRVLDFGLVRAVGVELEPGNRPGELAGSMGAVPETATSENGPSSILSLSDVDGQIEPWLPPFAQTGAEDETEEADDGPASGDLLAAPLTRTGTLMGTPTYMSPEQYLAQPTDARTDQFSFCVALYEALYGQRPFGDTWNQIHAAVLAGRIRPVPPGQPELAWLEPVLARGMARDPHERYPSMDKLLKALKRPARRRRRIPAIAGVLVLGSFAAGMAMAVLGRSASPPASSSTIANVDDPDVRLAGLPADPVKRRAIEELGRELAQIQLLLDETRVIEAMPRSQAAVQQARALGHKPLLAEALLHLGESHLYGMDVHATRSPLEEAALLAEEVGHQKVLARVLLVLALAQSKFTSDDPSVLHRRAAAAIERAGNPPSLRIGLEATMALDAVSNGQDERGTALIKTLRERLEGNPALPPMQAALFLYLMGVVEAGLDHQDSALALHQQALAMRRRHLGDQHPHVAVSAAEVASLLRSFRRYDEAREIEQELASAWENPDAAASLALVSELDAALLLRERQLVVTVVDAEGQPVPGAEVVAGERIQGDGKYLFGANASWRAEKGMARATTDSSGQARLAVRAGVSLVIAAEAPEQGRSSVATIGTTEERLSLRLKPYGQLEGRISVMTEAPVNILVCVTPDDSQIERFKLCMAPDADGRYAFERIDSGKHVALVSVLHDKTQSAHRVIPIEVPAGRTARTDVLLELGRSRLTVKVEGVIQGTVDAVQGMLMPGRMRNMSTVEELMNAGLKRMKKQAMRHSNPLPGQPLVFSHLQPGRYTLCIVPVRGDVRDPRMRLALNQQAGRLEAQCKYIKIPAEPVEQEISMQIAPLEQLKQVLGR